MYYSVFGYTYLLLLVSLVVAKNKDKDKETVFSVDRSKLADS